MKLTITDTDLGVEVHGGGVTILLSREEYEQHNDQDLFIEIKAAQAARILSNGQAPDPKLLRFPTRYDVDAASPPVEDIVPETTPLLERALEQHEMYLTYQAAGFSEPRAFQLVKAILQAEVAATLGSYDAFDLGDDIDE